MHKAQLVAIHSFRGGTGKSNLVANAAYLAARRGARVAALDADLHAPALHTLFGVDPKQVLHSLSEFVQGGCEIHELPIDLTHALDLEGHGGSLHLLPASTELEVRTSILFDGYDVARLNEGLLHIADELRLDYVLLDTHLGFNRETLLSLAVCDTIVVLLRPDRQDHQAACTLVQLATKLGVPSLLFVPNMFTGDDADAFAADIEREFELRVAGVLPWCREVLEFGSRALFAAEHPDHSFTKDLERLCDQLLPLPVTNGVAR